LAARSKERKKQTKETKSGRKTCEGLGNMVELFAEGLPMEYRVKKKRMEEYGLSLHAERDPQGGETGEKK
jgi:hypothetical protein